MIFRLTWAEKYWKICHAKSAILIYARTLEKEYSQQNINSNISVPTKNNDPNVLFLPRNEDLFFPFFVLIETVHIVIKFI